jgi:hypothetical protein
VQSIRESVHQVSQLGLWVGIPFPFQCGPELRQVRWLAFLAIHDLILELANRVLGQIKIRACCRVIHPSQAHCGHLRVCSLCNVTRGSILYNEIWPDRVDSEVAMVMVMKRD